MEEFKFTMPARTNERKKVTFKDKYYPAVHIKRYWDSHGDLIFEKDEIHTKSTVRLETHSYDWLERHWIEHKAFLNNEDICGEVIEANDFNGNVLVLKVIDGWG